MVVLIEKSDHHTQAILLSLYFSRRCSEISCFMYTLIFIFVNQANPIIINMESINSPTTNSFKILCLSRKAMLRQELLPFLQLSDIVKFLKLCKSSKALIEEHFTSNWSNLSLLLAAHFQLDPAKFSQSYSSYDALR